MTVTPLTGIGAASASTSPGGHATRVRVGHADVADYQAQVRTVSVAERSFPALTTTTSISAAAAATDGEAAPSVVGTSQATARWGTVARHTDRAMSVTIPPIRPVRETVTATVAARPGATGTGLHVKTVYGLTYPGVLTPSAGNLWVLDYYTDGVVGPNNVYVGPDAAVATPTSDQFAELGANGVTTYYMLPSVSWVSGSLSPDGEGGIWFGAARPNSTAPPSIDHLSATGQLTTFQLPAAVGGVQLGGQSITASTAGPDGSVWFDTYNPTTGAITVISRAASGALTFDTSAAIPAGASGPMLLGMDGQMWFVSDPLQSYTAGAALCSLAAVGGTVTCLTSSEIGDMIVTLAAGPDGHLWYADAENNAVGHLTGAGSAVEFVGPDIGIDAKQEVYLAQPMLVAGPAQSIWLANFDGEKGKLNKVGTLGAIEAITTTGQVTQYESKNINLPDSVAIGADGAVRFVDNNSHDPFFPPVRGVTQVVISSPNGAIGRLGGNGQITVNHGGPLGSTDNVLAAGRAGAWFDDTSAMGIGFITPAGTITTYYSPKLDIQPFTLAYGPGGSVWFSGNPTGGQIGELTGNHRFVVFTGPPPIAGSGSPLPIQVATGPGGKSVWFTSLLTDNLVRVQPNGLFTVYSSPEIYGPLGITAGPDGDMWFTNARSDTIGLLTPSGKITLYYGTFLAGPDYLAAAPDGKSVWAVNNNNNSVTQLITSTGDTKNYYLGPTGTATELAVASNGTVWVPDNGSGNNTVTAITPAGKVSTFTIPGVANPIGVSAGPDGSFWIAGFGSVSHLTPT
jgi:streptogramin lyase